MRAQVQIGDPVGLQAAEAISQPTMQMVMNNFHKAGSTEVGNSGMQVISELLNLRKMRKASRAEVHFRKTDLSFRDALYLSKAFVAPSVKSLLSDNILGISFRVRAYGEPAPSHYALYEAFTGSKIPSPTPELPVPYLRLSFDSYRLFEARVSTSDVALSLIEHVVCVPSPTSEAYVDIYSTIPLPTVESTGTVATASGAKSASSLKSKRQGVLSAIAAARVARASAEDETPQRKDLEDISRVIPALTSATGTFLGHKSEQAVNQANAPLLFLQTFVVPKIANETFVVTSRVAQRPLASLVPSGTGTGIANSGGISLFRRAEVIVTPVTSIMRGATKTLDSAGARWRIWLDDSKILSLRVPREKAVDLCRARFPEASVRLVEGVSGLNTHVELVFSEPHVSDPFDEIKKEFNKSSDQHKDELRDSLSKMVGINDRRALLARFLKPRPPIVVHGEYVHVCARNTIANVQGATLSRLITHPAINGRTTITNNFYEIATVRGIEAARSYILQEIITVVENTGSHINPRHIELIVDVMTSSGTLMPFTPRGSTLRQQNGAYSDSSFDQAPQAFLRSAVIGAPEPVTATSAAILLGTVPTFGTGTFRIIPPGGYMPPEYMTDALAEAAKITTHAAFRGSAAKADEPFASLSTLLDSRLTDGEATSIQQETSAEAVWEPIDGALGFNPNIWPPTGPDATYGTLSNREALSIL